MNSILSIHTVRFILLVTVQVLILNHINFLGYLNPYIYILFVGLYPVRNNSILLMLLSFLLGITIDFFMDTGGIHAAACVFIAYIRPLILKYTFGMIYEHQSIRFNAVDFGSRLSYFAILTLIHHIILFSLEIFNLSNILLIIEKTVFSSIFTILLSLTLTIIFSKKPK